MLLMVGVMSVAVVACSDCRGFLVVGPFAMMCLDADWLIFVIWFCRCCVVCDCVGGGRGGCVQCSFVAVLLLWLLLLLLLSCLSSWPSSFAKSFQLCHSPSFLQDCCCSSRHCPLILLAFCVRLRGFGDQGADVFRRASAGAIAFIQHDVLDGSSSVS